MVRQSMHEVCTVWPTGQNVSRKQRYRSMDITWRADKRKPTRKTLIFNRSHGNSQFRLFFHNMSFTATTQGAAAKQATNIRMLNKPTSFSRLHQHATEPSQKIGRSIPAINEDSKETIFLFQRLSMPLQSVRWIAVSFVPYALLHAIALSLQSLTPFVSFYAYSCALLDK